MSAVSQEKSYGQIFQEYGILPKFRGPEYYRLERLDDGELAPIPTEILVDGEPYTLHESGAIVSTAIEPIRHDEMPTFELARQVVIRSGVHLGGHIAMGQSCIIEKGATLRDVDFGNHVIIEGGASIIESTIEGGTPDEPVNIGSGTAVWDSKLGLCTSVGANSRLVNSEVGELVSIGRNVMAGNPGLEPRKKKIIIGSDSILSDGSKIQAGRVIKERTLVHPYDQQYPVKRIERGDNRTW